jgi:phage terminase large subunit-like protein
MAKFTYPDDPATAYALDVIEGREVASRLVTLACRRHLDDLEHAAERSLTWRVDEAQAVCDFFPEILRLPDQDDDGDGDEALEAPPFTLAGWERFVAGSLMGWYTVEGHRRFRVAYCEVGKGAGKTCFAGGLLLYLLVTATRAKQFYCAATAQQQARYTFDDCVRMVQASPHLRGLIDVRANNLAILSTGAFIRPISSEKRGLDGKRVAAAVVDELHEHPDEIVTAKLRAGIKADPDGLIFEITNSGADLETVCGRHHTYSIDVLTRKATNDSWFAFVAHLDACEACLAAGSFQPNDDCAVCDDWKAEGPHWRKANPGLGSTLPWSYLREQVREGLDIPSQRNLIRRLNFCQWVRQGTIWIPEEKWIACGDPMLTLESLEGREVYLGIDLSAKIDPSAVALVFPRALDDTGGDTLNLCVEVITRFWMPANTLRRRVREDKVAYDEWAKTGALITTPGDLVDHDAIADFILNDIVPRFHVKGIGIDQAGATMLITKLQRELGEEIVIEIPQSFRHLSEPCKTLEALIVASRLRHDRNPMMTWCMSNLAIEENRWREIRPVKVSQKQRIDGAVALIDGLAVLGLKYQPEQGSVYDDPGWELVIC